MESVPRELEPYLPTLDRARAAGVSLQAKTWYHLGSGIDLLAEEPVEQHRLAAVTVDACVLYRAVWEKNVEVSEQLLATYPTVMPPPPERMIAASHHLVADVLDRGPRPCTNCPVRPGHELCARCGGAGYIVVDAGRSQHTEICFACGGERFVQCSTCDGTALCRRARVRYVDDRVSALRYTYVPSMTVALETALDEALAAGEDLPDCLRFDPRSRAAGGPYRAGGAVEPTFHGHRFGDALGRAAAAIGGLGGDGLVLRQELVTYARPILWLRYSRLGSRHDAVLAARADGDLFAYVAP
jgi:hypothetical protein